MNIAEARQNMIKQQLRTGDVLEPSILALYENIARDAFVPTAFREFAYSDLQIALPHHQRMMTPLEEALLLQALQLNGSETILEVGTGSGFLTALLATLGKHVFSVEYYQDLTDAAKQKLAAYHIDNVTLLTANAAVGLFDYAPYDVVILSAIIPKVTVTHQLQVMPGGKLFALVGNATVAQGQLHSIDRQGQWTMRIIFETSLPVMM